ncbi:helix-turn-helix domain-containing protein [Krasilnikovia sp. MM14-A1259]|uniref:helix-turn-helix domain-containing protein n=1 Tax=Krasilnikovia sp. MM14-A1259 TaxID=3373539 RepID=UPI0037F7A660
MTNVHTPVWEHMRTELVVRRALLGFTQAEAAAAARISREALSTYERGARNPPVDVLSRLAAVYGLRLALLPEEEP